MLLRYRGRGWHGILFGQAVHGLFQISQPRFQRRNPRLFPGDLLLLIFHGLDQHRDDPLIIQRERAVRAFLNEFRQDFLDLLRDETNRRNYRGKIFTRVFRALSIVGNPPQLQHRVQGGFQRYDIGLEPRVGALQKTSRGVTRANAQSGKRCPPPEHSLVIPPRKSMPTVLADTCSLVRAYACLAAIFCENNVAGVRADHGIPGHGARTVSTVVFRQAERGALA